MGFNIIYQSSNVNWNWSMIQSILITNKSLNYCWRLEKKNLWYLLSIQSSMLKLDLKAIVNIRIANTCYETFEIILYFKILCFHQLKIHNLSLLESSQLSIKYLSISFLLSTIFSFSKYFLNWAKVVGISSTFMSSLELTFVDVCIISTSSALKKKLYKLTKISFTFFISNCALLSSYKSLKWNLTYFNLKCESKTIVAYNKKKLSFYIFPQYFSNFNIIFFNIPLKRLSPLLYNI